MKKILLLAESYPSHRRNHFNGGVEIVVKNTIEDLIKMNKVIVICEKNHKNDKELKFDKNLSFLRVGPPSKNTSASLKRAITLALRQIKYFSASKAIEFDQIISMNHTTYLTGAVISILRKKPLTLYWMDLLGPSWLRFFGLTGLLGFSVEIFCTKIKFFSHIAISKSTKKKLIERGVKPDKIKIRYPRIAITPPKKPFKKDARTILIVSRLVKYKRVDLAVHIFSKVLKKIPDAKLIIVGSGPEKQKIEKLIKKYNLDGNVEMKSNISNFELNNLYKKSEVFLHLSLIEGYGLVVQEAISFGCKVIATDIPVLREVTRNSENVKLISQGCKITDEIINAFKT